MKTYNIIFSDIAYNNLIEIDSYISETLKNPEAAKFILTEIGNSIENSAMFPNSGSLSRIPKLAEHGVRFKVVENYVVFYQPDDERQVINVLYVKYGGTDLSKLSF